MNVLARIQYGSHLYGTSTPESDWDVRLVYLPTTEECLLGRVRHSFKLPDLEDGHAFSLQEFVRLAAEGQSIAVELLHAPVPSDADPIWRHLVANRTRFHTKRMDSLVGFSRSMAAKYSSRADRLAETEAILAAIDSAFVGEERLNMPRQRLHTIWARLPESANAVKTTNDRNAGTEKRVYQVCGREVQATVTCAHACEVIKAIHDSYGERVRAAKEGRIDWKSYSHAFRAALQCKEIVETGDLVFPLKDAVWLREVKLGHVDFYANGLDKRLDDLIAEVSAKMAASNLPERVDQAWLDSIVLQAYDLA